MATENVKVISIETANAQKSIKDLRNQLKAYKDEMSNLEEGSEEFLKVAAAAGQVKHQIDEITQSIAGASADFGDMLGSATGAASGIVAGFVAAQSALNLFGIEGENVTKAIAKLQSMMGILQAVSQMDTAIKSFKKFTAALKVATAQSKLLSAALQPKWLLAISAAISGIVVIWKKWGDNIKALFPQIKWIETAFNKVKDIIAKIFDDAEDRNDKLLEDIEKLREAQKTAETDYINSLKDRNTQLQQQLLSKTSKETREAIKANEDELDFLKKKQSYLTANNNLLRTEYNLYRETGDVTAFSNKETQNAINNIKATSQTAKDEYDGITQYLNLTFKNLSDSIASTNREITNLTETITIQYEKAKEEANDLTETEKEILNINKDRVLLDTQLTLNEISRFDYIDKSLEAERKRLTLLEKGTTEYLRTLKTIQSLEAEQSKLDVPTDDLYKDSLEILNTLNKAGAKQRTQFIKDGETVKEVVGEVNDAIVEDTEYTLADLVNSNELAFEAIKGIYREDTFYWTEEQKKKLAILKKALEEGLISQQEYNRGVLTLQEQSVSNQLQQYSDIAYGLSDIFASIADNMDTTNKEDFERQKKFKATTLTLDIIAGVGKALAGGFADGGVLGWIMSALQAAAIATNGAMQLAKLKNTTYDSSSSDIGSGSISTSAISSTIVPPTVYSQAVTGAEISGSIKDTRVYVTESDISKTQKKVSVIEGENKW